MFLRYNLLDDYGFNHVRQTWKEYFLSIFAFMINFPLDVYYIFRVQMYIYYLGNYKKENIFSPLSKESNQNPHIISQKETNRGKIVCWNIQYGNAIFKLDTIDEMINFLVQENPEIVVLQEILKNNKINQIELLTQKLGFSHSYFQENIDLQNLKLGNLILSNKPINILKSVRQYQIVEVERNDKKLIICNVHFPSDLTCIKQKKLISNLILDIQKVKTENADSEFLITGDFNLLSWSKEIKDLQSTVNLLPNRQYTFPSNYPLVKYDYVFHHGFQTEPILDIRDITLSDHTPMVIQLS